MTLSALLAWHLWCQLTLATGDSDYALLLIIDRGDRARLERARKRRGGL